MAKLPLVAIIGRPNTGKSTLFNKIVGERLAIESEVAGTTRDHIASKITTDDVDYLLVDTGGMGGGTEDEELEDDVHLQSLLALTHADIIILTLNGREEITSSDREVMELLRKKKQKHVPVLLVITKCDNERTIETIGPEYYELGIADEIFPVSAFHRLGVEELEEAIVKKLKKLHFSKAAPTDYEKEATSSPRVAIIGKPNVGKSSLVNALMSETQRSVSPRLVSDIPGTTRDSADTFIRHKEQEYIFVDTAGLRRQSKTEEGIESFAMMRTIQALESCDVAVLMLDATEEVSKQDKRIASMAVEAGKGIMIVLNKTDLIDSQKKKEKLLEIQQQFLFCKYAPVLTVSTKTKEGLLKLFPMIDMIKRNRLLRVPTKELHHWLLNAISTQPMTALHSAKHITQTKDPPPSFVIFVRHPKYVQVSMLRYLDNRLRETFGLEGVPVRRSCAGWARGCRP